MDLLRGPFSMIEGGSDWEKALVVNAGAQFEADFNVWGAKADFEVRNSAFVEKVSAAIEYARTGQE